MNPSSPPPDNTSGSALTGPLDAALQALLDLLLKGNLPQDLPGALQQNPRFQELLSSLTSLQQFAWCIANGDLSQRLSLMGPTAGSLKSLQASLRHLTWQAQTIAGGDFSQRVDFMGEFSSAFNRMVENLEEARNQLQQREAELARSNANLRQEISERKWAEQALQERVRFEILLYQIGQAVASDLDLNEVLKTLQEKCQEMLPFDAFYVAVYEAKTHLIRHVLYYDQGLYYNLEPRDIRVFPGLSGEVISGRKTVYIADTLDPDLLQTNRLKHSGGKPIRSYVGVPLVARDQIVGVLSIQSYQPEAFKPDQIRLLETIANQAAIAVENANLFEQMRQLAITDPLTALSNRRQFWWLANNEIERSVRYHRPLAAIMLDIDHFKKVNDTYGHAVGDAVLQHLAEVCRSNLRVVDIIGRYGGEEFAIVLPETDPDSARGVAERLRGAVEASEVTSSQGTVKITISLGIAGLDSADKSLEIMLDRADQALYTAKREGRNRVSVYGMSPSKP
jgi:diguanylate cyclase (GGDEF)-like protein